MAAGKTGALLAASAAIGAVLAGAPAGLAAALRSRTAPSWGSPFQLVDDLLGHLGRPGGDRQAGLSDLRSRQEVAAGDLRPVPRRAAGRALACA